MPRRSLDPGDAYFVLIIGISVVLFLSFGVRGLWQYAHGVRSDAADPWTCAAALLSVPWMARIMRKLIRPASSDERLLSGPELLIFSLVSLGFAGWAWRVGLRDLRSLAVLLVAGAGGLALWWRRSRTESRATR